MKKDIKSLLEFAGVDVTKGKAKKLVERVKVKYTYNSEEGDLGDPETHSSLITVQDMDELKRVVAQEHDEDNWDQLVQRIKASKFEDMDAKSDYISTWNDRGNSHTWEIIK